MRLGPLYTLHVVDRVALDVVWVWVTILQGRC
jgi:hypothetical protein